MLFRSPVARAESEEWALALVAAGVGVAIVPAGVVGADPQIAARPLVDVALTRQVGLALPPRPAPAVLALCARAQARFAPVTRTAARRR